MVTVDQSHPGEHFVLALHNPESELVLKDKFGFLETIEGTLLIS